MPRKKKAPPERLITFVDDAGVERQLGKVYVEKFLFRGEPDTFMVFQDTGKSGHLIACICRRDVIQALTEMFTDARNILQRMPPKQDDK